MKWHLLAVAAVALVAGSAQAARNPFVGRWDMTITAGDDEYPSWMEVTQKDGALEARVQGRTGNVNPAAAVRTDGQRLIVVVTPMCAAWS